MVVTDDGGRYVLPDLPKGSYSIWVRGYGLVDSPKVKSAPGKILNLKAVVAPNDSAAAQYYPAIHWYAMMKIPDKSEFGGKSNIPTKITQADWLNSMMKSNGCVGCHQMGQLATRTSPRTFPTRWASSATPLRLGSAAFSPDSRASLCSTHSSLKWAPRRWNTS